MIALLNLQLQVRFGGEDTKVLFTDEYEDIDDYKKMELSTTTTTTTSRPPVVLDPIMQAMMETVDLTELAMRFGHLDENGLAVRNAFGEPLDAEPAADAFR